MGILLGTDPLPFVHRTPSLVIVVVSPVCAIPFLHMPILHLVADIVQQQTVQAMMIVVKSLFAISMIQQLAIAKLVHQFLTVAVTIISLLKKVKTPVLKCANKTQLTA